MHCSWDPVVFLMPVRGALTLGTAAQELVEGLIMQLAERQVCSQQHLVLLES